MGQKSDVVKLLCVAKLWRRSRVRRKSSLQDVHCLNGYPEEKVRCPLFVRQQAGVI